MSLLIENLRSQPCFQMPFLNAGKRGGVVRERLPYLVGGLHGLPEGLDALLITSDLQGISHGELLGIQVAADYQSNWRERGWPDPSRTGAVLAGDFYSSSDGAHRGATGNVRAVWLKFQQVFAWVVGVAGNHDDFGRGESYYDFLRTERLDVLSTWIVGWPGITIGGQGGSIGDSRKIGQHDEENFLYQTELILMQTPDLLVLHAPPEGAAGQKGSRVLRQLLERYDTRLTICGHVHWNEPLAMLQGGQQVINVDKRVVLLKRLTDT